MNTSAALTPRQQREARFYRDYAARQKVADVDFAPVESQERRPWNPYWYVYGLVRQRYVGPTQRVLDFGCGVGIAAVRFARLGYDVEGFDLSPENIAEARDLAARYKVESHCRFGMMLAEGLEYPDASFDIVVGIDILHHVEIGRAIDEAWRVLKPGGVAIFKEHVEAPVVDPIRNTRLVRALAPKDASLDEHITHDERKLNAEDLVRISRRFARVEEERFTLLSRIDRVVPHCGDVMRGRLQKLDQALMRACPALTRFGGTVVLTCHKESP
ncbi:MAG: class I SAM-dependent methyltransferase [Planctomycetota bacterium]|nr:class I SAM-dependent methyltransferase [Planctomycetota bacterium]